MFGKKAPTPEQIEKRIEELTAAFHEADAEYEKLNSEVAQLLYEGKVEVAEDHDTRLAQLTRRMDNTAAAVKVAKRELAEAQERLREAERGKLEAAVAKQQAALAESKGALVEALAALERSFVAFSDDNDELTRLAQKAFGPGSSQGAHVRKTQLNRTIWDEAPTFAKFCGLPRPALGGSGRAVAGLSD
ncbi:MAG: hypothetical protein AB7G08_31960 [Hyphomicrobiaceae bacterium]